MKIVNEEPLMSYTVEQTTEGYIILVKAHGRTINEWNLGLDEDTARSKVATIVETYLNGLEFIQDQVRDVFSGAENP